MHILSPIQAKRLASKVSLSTNKRITRKVMGKMNTKAYTLPANPAYRENVRITESEAKTLNDALQELLFPKRIMRNTSREQLGPESIAMASFMRTKLEQSNTRRAKAGIVADLYKRPEQTPWTSDELQDWLQFPVVY